MSAEAVSDTEYDRYLTALGQLCACWAALDREISHLIGTILTISDDQMDCLATEMGDVAPRCRLLRNLVYTFECPEDYRRSVHRTLNIITKDLAPARNRFIHDRFGEEGQRVLKIDQRMKLTKPQSFLDLRLSAGGASEVSSREVYTLAAKVMFVAGQVASARFDVTSLQETGGFPAEPQLTEERLNRIAEYQLPTTF